MTARYVSCTHIRVYDRYTIYYNMLYIPIPTYISHIIIIMIIIPYHGSLLSIKHIVFECRSYEADKRKVGVSNIMSEALHPDAKSYGNDIFN